METTTENIMAAINRRNIVEFPGCDALGLNPDVPSEKLIADAVVYGVQAVQWYNSPDLMEMVCQIENIPGYVKLETMREYGVVNLDDVMQAIYKLDTNEIEPVMHDAY